MPCTQPTKYSPVEAIKGKPTESADVALIGTKTGKLV
jgi:hypothetical protein